MLTKKLLKINGKTVAVMQEMTHRAHVFKKKIGGGGMPPHTREHAFCEPGQNHRPANSLDKTYRFFKSKCWQV